MKHNVGDVVRIKSKKWYDENKKGSDSFRCQSGFNFTSKMSDFCGLTFEIIEERKSHYRLKGIGYCWTDEMFEDSMEDPLSEESLNNFTCLIPEPCFCWEQRRYELVKSIMSNVLQKSILSDRDVKFNAQRAIDLADEVIKQLKEKEGK